jgi:hypothetical protein
MLNAGNRVEQWSLYTGQRGECVGHAYYTPAQGLQALPNKIAAPLSVMLIAKGDVKTVGRWYERLPPRLSVDLGYAGAAVWIDALPFTYNELTHIRGLPEWQTIPKHMDTVLNLLRHPQPTSG